MILWVEGQGFLAGKSGKHFLRSGQVRPRQGTEICNFGAASPLEALHWIFWFLSSIYVQFSKTSPLKSGESSEKSSGENRVKSCHVCGCHGFFGPDQARKTGHVRPRQGTEICNFFWGAPSPLDAFEFSPEDVFPFLQVYCAS